MRPSSEFNLILFAFILCFSSFMEEIKSTRIECWWVGILPPQYKLLGYYYYNQVLVIAQGVCDVFHDKHLYFQTYQGTVANAIILHDILV